MDFKVGDKVKFLDEEGYGVIKKLVNENQAMVEIDGFEYLKFIDGLVPVNEEEEEQMNKSVDKQQFFTKDFKNPHIKKESSANTVKRKGGQDREVDLHIDELVKDHYGMKNYEIVKIQLDHFIRQLEKAITNRERKIIFIHGKGEGVLKSEIRRILRSYEGITYYDASYRRYGYGATAVEIH